MLMIVLIGFWASWFSLVTFTNVIDLLAHQGWLNRLLRFRSRNFDLICDVTRQHNFSEKTNLLLFILVIIIEAGAGLLFWRALLALLLGGFGADPYILTIPISAGIFLFAGFMLASEYFQVYTKEDTFVRILGLLLLSSLCLTLWS